jgi:hypothetical protein
MLQPNLSETNVFDIARNEFMYLNFLLNYYFIFFLGLLFRVQVVVLSIVDSEFVVHIENVLTELDGIFDFCGELPLVFLDLVIFKDSYLQGENVDCKLMLLESRVWKLNGEFLIDFFTDDIEGVGNLLIVSIKS